MCKILTAFHGMSLGYDQKVGCAESANFCWQCCSIALHVEESQLNMWMVASIRDRARLFKVYKYIYWRFKIKCKVFPDASGWEFLGSKNSQNIQYVAARIHACNTTAACACQFRSLSTFNHKFKKSWMKILTWLRPPFKICFTYFFQKETKRNGNPQTISSLLHV